MYCKNCGAQINGGARFCSLCGYDQSLDASFRPDYGWLADPYGRAAYVNVEEEKKMMKVALAVAFLVTIVFGAIIGFVALILMVMYYTLAKKAPTDVTVGSIISGVIGLVIGYILNYMLALALIFSIV